MLLRWSVYSYGPATTGPASAKAPGAVVLWASTTRIPLATVSAPLPPALVMRRNVWPVAEPPSITSLSDGEPSVCRKVFRPIVPPAPT
mgnify:CR=1 FL=1